MILLHAFFGLVPWWAWVIAIAVLIGVTYLGLWAPLMALLAKVPLNVWLSLAAVIAIAVGFNAWLESHDDRVKAAAEKAKDDFYLAREKAANDAAQKRATELARQLELATNAAEAAASKAQAASDARAAAKDARIKQLEEERSHDITPEADRRCDLTRGVILHFNRGAEAANAAAEPAPGEAAARPDGEDVDASSGIALDRYAAAVEQTQSALGTCRNQVIDWQTHYATVLKPWIDTATAALSSCIPQP